MASNDSKQRQTRRWSREEHDKFLRGLEMFPNGPWSRIAALVGTRTTRQTMTHAQKYRERMTRRANEVNALWDAHGRAANPSFALLQETVRSLPLVESNSSSTQLSSSDEELLEDIGAGAGTAELDELDLRILMSLLSPETESHTACAAVEPMMLSMEAESQHLDNHIWGLLADLADDIQLQGEAW